FLVDEDEFDAAFARIRDQGLAYYAEPGGGRPGHINHRWGGRGVYFDDPDHHARELLTRAPSPTPTVPTKRRLTRSAIRSYGPRVSAPTERLRDPRQRAERAARILDAAADLLLRHGYRRVTIDDVAAGAGIGKGTVYLHWKAREQLFSAV